MVARELSAIVGKPLTNMWRYAGRQVFAFGPEIEAVMEDGEPATITDCGLTVLSDWVIRGPARFHLESGDFGPENDRRDQHAKFFYDLVGSDPISVVSVTVSRHGALQFCFTRGYSLEVSPVADLEDWEEQWRFQPSSQDPRGQLILEPRRLRWNGESLAEGV